MFIADAHADSLMWNRDLTRRLDEGHVDLPRLREAGVGLQCFTLVTRGFPFIGGFPLFAAWRRWPRQARRSEWERALFQISRLRAIEEQSEGAIAVVGAGAQLAQNAAAGRISAILGIEGAHALEGRADRVEQLHARGVRFLGPVHLANNALGGSSFPLMGNKPLTAHGREVLEQMARLKMPVDLAHCSERTIDAVLESPCVPFTSHTGVRSAGGGWRNLSDAHLRAIADRGGVAAIIFATVYLGGDGTFDDVARHIERAIEVMGEDAVALGSDFDGMVPLPKGMRDVRDLPKIAGVLERRGMSSARIEKVMGLNLRRFFECNLVQ